MQRMIVTSQKLVAVFCFGVLAFNYPILSLFNRLDLPGGFPVLFLYIFGAWLLVIALAMLIIERRKPITSAYQRIDG